MREYNTKQRKAVQNVQVNKEKQKLSHIVQSVKNENVFYCANKEGGILVVDRRKNYALVRKFVGC